MIIFTILLIAALILAAVTAIAILIGGAGVAIVFGDLIVFGLIVWAIIRLFRRRK